LIQNRVSFSISHIVDLIEKPAAAAGGDHDSHHNEEDEPQRFCRYLELLTKQVVIIPPEVLLTLTGSCDLLAIFSEPAGGDVDGRRDVVTLEMLIQPDAVRTGATKETIPLFSITPILVFPTK